MTAPETPRYMPICGSYGGFKREEVEAARSVGATAIVIAVPWQIIAPHEERARRNHGGQSLETLRQRGGLSDCEAVAILENRPWVRMRPGVANARLAAIIADRTERLEK